MKTVTIGVTLMLALTFLTCQDSGNSHTPFDSSFYKNVGKQIPFEVGMRWIDAYSRKNKAAGRTGDPNFVVSAAQFLQMLNSVSNLVGVVYHYAMDDSGTMHIILIPLDESLSLWSAMPDRVYLDANTGLPISQNVAHAWAENFKTANPNAIWYHFFGKNIFDEITAIPFFTELEVKPAINDQDQTPQLLLIIWEPLGSITGRTGSQQGTVYDASNPCPPHCTAK